MKISGLFRHCQSALLIAALMMPLSSVPAAGTTALKSPVSHATMNYTSGPRSITIERFSSDSNIPQPAVVLVHGADGLQSPVWNARYREYARQLAARGFVVYFPHYFERTGSGRADLMTILQFFALWRETVADAVSFAASQPGVDSARIALTGVSLGGALSLSLAAHDERIKAVAELSGFYPSLGSGMIERLPPVLILHGADDSLIPVDEAYRIEREVRALKTPYEIKIYPSQGHGLTGQAADDALNRTADFLGRYLSAR
ncbi:MAG TPA: dienelactone hydrolase family protein [Blastocatellia bacterium]|nr:dienelactone hydrolase family protein [Blastocatellia bacterium]